MAEADVLSAKAAKHVAKALGDKEAKDRLVTAYRIIGMIGIPNWQPFKGSIGNPSRRIGQFYKDLLLTIL